MLNFLHPCDLPARQIQHRDIIRQERAKYEVIETSDEVEEVINIMPPKEVTEQYQQAMEKPPSPISNYKESTKENPLE